MSLRTDVEEYLVRLRDDAGTAWERYQVAQAEYVKRKEQWELLTEAVATAQSLIDSLMAIEAFHSDA